MGVFDSPVQLPCTDADVAEVAIGDFAVLTARSERLAYGEDGTIPAQSFVLTSAFPFSTQGVEHGHVMVLESARVGSNDRPIPGGVMPVVSCTTTTCTLSRIGYPTGQGAFAGLPGGSTGVKFYVPSLLAQIRTAYQEVLRRLDLTPTTPLAAPTDLRLITILVVLRGLYFAQYRQSSDDTWKSKMDDLDKQIADLYADLKETYSISSPQSREPVSGVVPDDPAWVTPLSYGSSERYGAGISRPWGFLPPSSE